MSVREEAAQGTTGGLSHKRILVIFAGLMMGLLLAALDQTVVATALLRIVGELGGDDNLSWVVTAYMLAAPVSVPLYGKDRRLYGRKQIFQSAIVIFPPDNCPDLIGGGSGKNPLKGRGAAR